ncbi:MAG TPA: DNA cytosine methyltransferase [Herpetosiphonaceae bacterium]
MRSVELFAGAGGLALGVSQAGFSHDAVIERDQPTCTTIRENQQRAMAPVKDWPLFSCDTRDFEYAQVPSGVDLVAGGPPCQPFSMGGKHGGYRDQRDMFPEAVRAVRELQPRAFIFENVKGLLRQSFFKYFGYIQLQLTYPEIIMRPDEEWMDHLARLEQHHTSASDDGLHYRLVYRLLNAADYGVPQRRERVFLVGFRSDLGIEWSFPDATHAQAALAWSQWGSGEYWERHGVQQPAADGALQSAQQKGRPLLHKPWLTIRDAIHDLPDPEQPGAGVAALNHEYRAGARSYKGHTGSPLDMPAKTLKAGDHGVPGGENMLVLPDGRVRYFTVRESARLQGFPDDYLFPVSWTESMRQLGNAVPVGLGYVVARSVRERLETKQ